MNHVQRLHRAVDAVVDEMGDELKWTVDTSNDGSFPDLTKEQLIRDTLLDVQFEIEGLLGGFSHNDLPPGRRSSEVPLWRANLSLGIMEDWMDIVFVRVFLDGLEEMRKRFFALPAMVFSAEMPVEISAYVVQAKQCYFFGLFQASAVLARAALERALLDRIGDELQRTSATVDLLALTDLGKRAGLITPEQANAAHNVRKTGNRAAHGGLVESDEAQASLIAVRHLITELYPAIGPEQETPP